MHTVKGYMDGHGTGHCTGRLWIFIGGGGCVMCIACDGIIKYNTVSQIQNNDKGAVTYYVSIRGGRGFANADRC